MTRWYRGSVALFAVLCWTSAARAQCGGTQLCAPGAGTCTVAAPCTITLPAGGLTIDLGARRLVISKPLTVVGQAGARLEVLAGDVLVDGGDVVAPGADGLAGRVSIRSATGLTVRNDALFDVSGAVGAGSVELLADGGPLSFAGRVKANGTSRTADGGDVTLVGSGDVAVSGSTIDVSGGDQSFGGFILLQSNGGGVAVTSSLNAAGGDGGDVAIAAIAGVTTSSSATIRVGATGDAGSGGDVDVLGGLDVAIAGEVQGNGAPAVSSEDQQSGGDGADVSLASEAGSVDVTARVEVVAAAAGLGGTISADALHDVTFTRPLVATSTGDGGAAGDLTVVAGGDVSLGPQVQVAGGTGSGGIVDVIANGNLTVPGTVTVSGDQFGGTISLQGCALEVTTDGALTAQGPGIYPGAANLLRGSSAITINGDLLASTQNVIQYRATPPVFGPRATVQPAATLQLTPTLPCCVACPVTTTTTSVPGSTTTTTSTSVTTTTLVPVCGNRIVEAGEQCDDGNAAAGDCCAACRFEPAGNPCASDGNACTLDVCNATGVCTHPAGNAGAQCRAAAGLCDQAELCTGTAPTCPPDVKSVAVCRAATGGCDVEERCNGVSDTCPADGVAAAGTVCRAAAGLCDLAEACDGASKACPADVKRTTECRAANGVCDVAERCDGVGNDCPGDAKVPNGSACGAGACGTGGMCEGGLCTGGEPTGCGPCQTCDLATGGCVAALRPSCEAPIETRKAQLVVKRSLRGPSSDKLLWKWTAGPATTLGDFGDPLTSGDLAFCLFDRSQAAPRLIFRAEVPAGGTCNGRPCWKASGTKGFKFRSTDGAADGVTGISLIAGDVGRSKIKLDGRGVNLTSRPFGLPRPSLAVPMTAQLQSAAGGCWEATYSRPGLSRNDGVEFNGRSD